MSKTPLERAISIVGSQAALARLLGVRQSLVFYWRHRAVNGVPAEYCKEIEEVTAGKVTRAQLRPDLWKGANW